MPSGSVSRNLSMTTHQDPRERRDRLFKIHSTLRSADNLRPDEAFDELVKLYSIWSENDRPTTATASDARRVGLKLSAAARDDAFSGLAELLGPDGADLGSDLFQELVDVGVRAGLGQYFTPAPVSQAIADYLQPRGGETWMDPFLGSGHLLGSLAVAAPDPITLFGTDLDHRVLGLASLEAQLRHPRTPLSVAQISALGDRGDVLAAVGAPPEGVDGVVTNPPFGAVDFNRVGDNGYTLSRGPQTPIEVLGLEQSLRLLRAGGRMAIVLPQSVISNKRQDYVRRFIREQAAIDAVLSLPGETFSVFDGVGKACVLFLRKDQPTRSVWFGVASSVGWDTTGRAQGFEDVTATARALRQHKSVVGVVDRRPASEEFDRNLSPEWHLRSQEDGPRLDELARAVFLGKTPNRPDYCDARSEGSYRIVKVGDLTGRGIDWQPGARSFAIFRRHPASKVLQVGDILMTAAAHHPRYIAAKVDIVDVLPEGLEDRCVPSGEVLVVRIDPECIDPFVVLLWMRTAGGRAALQACVTGQTAHLHPDYVTEVHVPTALTADHCAAVAALGESLAARRVSEDLHALAETRFGEGLVPIP